MNKYMNKEQVYLRFVYTFVAIVIVQFVTLVYLSYFKTDIGYRVMARCGLIDYSNSESRHRIEYRCLEGWYNTLSKMNVQADLLFYGNSITYESDFQRFFPNKLVLNFGCNRDDLDDLINRSFIINSVHPRKIFVLGGINRLTELSLRDFESKYKMMVDTIISQNPTATIFLQSLLPVNPEMELGSRYTDCLGKIKEANVIIKNIAIKTKCVYIDLYSAYQIDDLLPRIYTTDGLHLTPDAYQVWANTIKKYVE